MWTLITHTPLYVWPLLLLLIWGGLQARKTHKVTYRSLLIFPTIMLIWSLYAALSQASLFSLSLWAVSILLGVFFGYLTVRRIPLHFDKESKILVIPGSYIPLILFLSIFALRYTLQATHALVSGFIGTPSYFLLEAGATLISGMFLGRILGYKMRFI
jgi:hypothetical protein